MKKLAPIIVTILVSGYLCFYIAIAFFINDHTLIGSIVVALLGVGSFGVLVAMIYTLIIRLKEIDKEDDDDISKY